MPKAKDAMTKNPMTVRAETSVAEVIQLLLEHHVSGVPVVDEHGFPVGIISEFSLLQVLEEPGIQDRPVAEFMTTSVLSVDEEDSLKVVVEKLRSFRIRRMPVLRDGRITGIVSRRDLLRFVNHTGKQVHDPQEDLSITVAIVDDDPSILRLLERMIRNALGNVNVVEFTNGRQARQWLTTQFCEILITDVDLPDMNGLDLLQQAKQREPWMQAFVITGNTSLGCIADAMRNGATDFLSKPLDSGEVVQQLRRAAKAHHRWLHVIESAAVNV